MDGKRVISLIFWIFNLHFPQIQLVLECPFYYALQVGDIVLSKGESRPTWAGVSARTDGGQDVDFEIDELVNLVRALFADTPLRTNTINKLMQGHPGQS